MAFENQANIEGRSASTITLSTSADISPLLEPGVYAVWSDVDAKIRVDVNAAIADGVTVANGFIVKATDSVLPVRITRPAYLGAIAEEAGTLYYHRIS